MHDMSDEDRLIRALTLHKALKQWTIAHLTQHGIACQETYGNDENGDIRLLNPADTPHAQQLLDEWQRQFNLNPAQPHLQPARSRIHPNPHLEIKTQYLYGKTVDLIIQHGTVIGILSISTISQPSRLKLNQADIAHVENVPLTELTEESVEGEPC